MKEWMSDMRRDIERKGALGSLLVDKIQYRNNYMVLHDNQYLSSALYFELNVRRNRSFDFSGVNAYCYRISAYCFSHLQGHILLRLHKSSSMIMHVSNFPLFL